MEKTSACLWLALFLTICRLYSAQNLVYHIPEEQPSNTFIGNVANDSNLLSVISETDSNTMRFSFLSRGDYYTKYFHVDDRTSAIFTKIRLDREQLCQFRTICMLPLEVAAQSLISSFFRILKVNIYLEDINDHSPTFSKVLLSLPIPEDVLVGTQYSIEGAKDLDNSQNFSLQKYELRPKDVPFSVQFVKNLDGSSLVRLKVMAPLDREKKEFYYMDLIALDGDSPPLIGMLLINVSVIDVNDNSPEFSHPLYNVTVSEDVKNGSLILTVLATDLDKNDNGLVNYRLSPHQADEIFELFEIDAGNGQIRVIGKLIFTPGKIYTVIVEAYDLSDKHLTSQALVYVLVEDGGNNPPEIHVNLLTNEGVAVISEIAKPGAVVAHISVVDYDTGRDGEVVCMMQSDDFRMDPLHSNEEYKVIVTRHLDHEKQNCTNVTVYCQDSGDPPLNSSSWFLVKILDENDNDPQFTQPLYETSMVENNKIGKSVLTVKAEDIDCGTNAEISYRLSSDIMEYVYIQQTGTIRAKRKLDREQASSLSFIVYALDGGSPQRTGSTTVKIQILDQNDEIPVFSRTSYEFSVSENNPSGTMVGSVSATDGDDGINAAISFMIHPIYDQKVPFIVFSDGTIKTKTKLDREIVSCYDFSIVVKDEGSPSLNSSVHIKILVKDENDNPPKIHFPSWKNNTVQFPLSTPPWSVIACIRATDDDEFGNENSRLKYMIINDTQLFRIHSDSGIIQVTDLILEQQYDFRIFELYIMVSDHGVPEALYTTAMLDILLYTENETSVARIPDEAIQSYVIIVITVGTATVVLTVGIVAIFCVIRKHGIKKQQQYDDVDPEQMDDMFDGSITVFSLPSEDSLLDEEKRKKFIYSSEEDEFSDGELVQQNATENKSAVYLTPQKMAEESFSESSGDSGRGGSNENIQQYSLTNDSSQSDKKKVNSPKIQQIIPFSFQKALNMPGSSTEERKTSKNKVLLQTDSGIHGDCHSDPEEKISSAVFV
ncbi:hypothetical protein CHS0354_000939 [Potamilus streckersoni]|uniref:Cadherin domain-containing protein n=1 Tax=Potamilus streckersoni TaxID=2493646 RepID=A0AAE0SRP8_9BIVA|nr:hypothetical protein CHS0354_000939 [Potamilus streckersoni]